MFQIEFLINSDNLIDKRKNLDLIGGFMNFLKNILLCLTLAMPFAHAGQTNHRPWYTRLFGGYSAAIVGTAALTSLGWWYFGVRPVKKENTQLQQAFQQQLLKHQQETTACLDAHASQLETTKLEWIKKTLILYPKISTSEPRDALATQNIDIQQINQLSDSLTQQKSELSDALLMDMHEVALLQRDLIRALDEQCTSLKDYHITYTVNKKTRAQLLLNQRENAKKDFSATKATIETNSKLLQEHLTAQQTRDTRIVMLKSKLKKKLDQTVTIDFWEKLPETEL